MKAIKPYIPILRSRPAEMLALERMYPQDRERVTPFIEFIMPPPKTDKDDRTKIVEDSKSKLLRQMSDVGERLLKYCGREAVFIDVHLLDGDIRADVFESILSATNGVDLFSIPVVHIVPVIGTDADMATREVAVKYAKMNDRGMCIRIDVSHFRDENLATHIDEFIKNNGLNIKNTDILVDLQIVDESTAAESVVEKLNRIPQIKTCRSFILTGGAFPKDLSEYPKHGNYQRERLDYALWQSVSNLMTSRKPYFSDYTIQHPIYYGNMPGANPSASVRYTDDTKWEIIRGEGLRNKKGAGFKQYLAHAREIIKQSFYKNASYSFGDSEINRIASQDEKTGNPQLWLNIGINHHLTLVARQIAAQHEKSTSD